MKKPLYLLGCTAMAAGLLLGTHAMAQTLSPNDFSTSKIRIKAELKIEKKACASLANNAKDICVAQAKGKESVALAELDNSYKPTLKTQYKVRMAKGEAAYDLDKEKCDDLSGNPKDVCKKEAKAALTAAKADAIVQMKTSELSSESRVIRAEAAADNRAAQLKVAQEKCDALASTAKDACLAAANASFGKL